MAEQEKATFHPMKTEDLVKNENFMKSLGKAIEGMKTFEEQKANNMYQNVGDNKIIRPVEIKLNKEGKLDTKKDSFGQSLTKYTPIDIVNAVNLMHTQLATGNREKPMFVSEATMKACFMKPKKDIEPTYAVEFNAFKGEYKEVKMYHVSQVEKDTQRLEKANEGRSTKLSAVDLSKVDVKVSEHEREYADNIRSSIAHFVETEGKGKLANLDEKKFAEKILGYSLQQRSEENFMKQLADTIRKEKAGMTPEQAKAFDDEYKVVKKEQQLLNKDPETKKRKPMNDIKKVIKEIAARAKGEEVTKKAAPAEKAPKAEAKADTKAKTKKKAKEGPAR